MFILVGAKDAENVLPIVRGRKSGDVGNINKRILHSLGSIRILSSEVQSGYEILGWTYCEAYTADNICDNICDDEVYK